MREILIVDSDPLFRKSLGKFLTLKGFNTVLCGSGQETFTLLLKGTPDIVILDMLLPKMNSMEVLRRLKKEYEHIPVVMMSAFGTVADVVNSLKLGAEDFIHKATDPELMTEAIMKILDSAGKSKDRGTHLVSQLKEQYSPEALVGLANPIKRIKQMLPSLCEKDHLTLLLKGHRGVGKLTLAKTIHYNSPQAIQPFVEINCRTLSSEAILAQVFGGDAANREKTPPQRQWTLEQLGQGAIYFNEIAHLSAELQTQLFQLIGTRKYSRMRDNQSYEAKFKIFLATEYDLAALVAKGLFQSDFWEYLQTVAIDLPDLPEREHDILALTGYFLKKFSEEYNVNFQGIHPGVIPILTSYAWPGNIRELKDTIKRAVLLNKGPDLRAEHLPQLASAATDQAMPDVSIVSLAADGGLSTFLPSIGINFLEMEKGLIESALRQSESNASLAAKLLHVSEEYLESRLKDLNIVIGA
jgi:DNA-binding NtrC family response regulator